MRGFTWGFWKHFFHPFPLLPALSINLISYKCYLQPGITGTLALILLYHWTLAATYLPCWRILTQGLWCLRLKTILFSTHTIWSYWKVNYLLHLITPCILTERKYLINWLSPARLDILSPSVDNNLECILIL